MTEAEGILDLIRTTPSTRSYDGRGVPRQTLELLIEAATCAPSPRNSQPWGFLVVDDRAKLVEISRGLEHRAAEMERLAEKTTDVSLRGMFEGGTRLMRSLGQALPALVFVCRTAVGVFPDEFVYSALFAAAQNLRLAARSMGLATAFTTIHTFAETTIRDVTGLPPDVQIAATIPIGYSASRFSRVKRKPVGEVISWNSWGRRE
jgi:nitroreductase